MFLPEPVTPQTRSPQNVAGRYEVQFPVDIQWFDQ